MVHHRARGVLFSLDAAHHPTQQIHKKHQKQQQAVEDVLRGLGVQWLVLASLSPLLGMWTGQRFGFAPLTLAELGGLQDRVGESG